jgi:hypothetical protein
MKMGTTCQKGFKYSQDEQTMMWKHSPVREPFVVSLRRGARVR